MEIDTVVFYQVTDPKLYTYGHANPLKAIEHLVATSLRNIVGGLELDETLTSRELINSKMRVILDEATDPWGIKITRVELRNIIISDVELAEAMEKQMIAEREKRAAILKAEGISQAEILEAQGKAEAIRLVNESKPSQEFLTIRALEAYEKAADGQATKIIVPSDLQGVVGLVNSVVESTKK
jgi:regulator of protease activity HflC (stomatin/prohibitin superfamily)